MDDPLRAKETFQRVVTEHAAAQQARRAELYLEYIQRRFGQNPPPRPADVPSATPPAPPPPSHG
jgi:hypothetical protein